MVTTTQQFLNMFRIFGCPDSESHVQRLLDADQSDEEKANLLLALYKAGCTIPTQAPRPLVQLELLPRKK
jgi:hypothetical protein